MQYANDKNKLYALNFCYFGFKVIVATMLEDGLVVGMWFLPGNPYDGHTLDEAID